MRASAVVDFPTTYLSPGFLRLLCIDPNPYVSDPTQPLLHLGKRNESPHEGTGRLKAAGVNDLRELRNLRNPEGLVDSVVCPNLPHYTSGARRLLCRLPDRKLQAAAEVWLPRGHREVTVELDVRVELDG